MTKSLSFLAPCVLATNVFLVVACSNAPSARKTGAVPTPTAPVSTRGAGDTTQQSPTTPQLKLFSLLEKEKASGALVRCVEFKTLPEPEAQEKQLRSPPADLPDTVEFSSPDAACPTEGIKAVCLTEVPATAGAYVRVNHGLSVNTPEKLAELKQKCESNGAKWSETEQAAAKETAQPTTGQGTPQAGASPTVVASPTTSPTVAASVVPQKDVTAKYSTFLNGVGAQSNVLCQIPVGAKITIKGTPVASTTSLGQVEANMVKTDSCLLEKASFVKSEWTGW